MLWKKKKEKKANCFPMNHTVSWHKEDKGRKLDVKLAHRSFNRGGTLQVANVTYTFLFQNSATFFFLISHMESWKTCQLTASIPHVELNFWEVLLNLVSLIYFYNHSYTPSDKVTNVEQDMPYTTSIVQYYLVLYKGAKVFQIRKWKCTLQVVTF